MSFTDARTEILQRIRAAGPIVAPEIPRNYRVASDDSPEARQAIVDQMEQALLDYSATVTRCTADGIPDAINAALSDAASVVVPAGLPEPWQQAAGRGRTVRVDDPPLTKDELDHTDATVAASRVAIAPSGTIVLDGEPDQGRRAITLVPDTLVVILRAEDIKGTVPEAVAVLSQHPQRPTTWIAGPSATSDIELVRVNGVHGPRILRVIIVE
ncbi:MAG: LUD domain-containing protein [Ancrocorticia sp.]|jgi:L-lactate dehydrogenase complex protein LldG|nr:LUD domain-containing protein [Ancrocorticia sp.]MCI1895591.1 LUD domain-containing protein [Ancrocorticia sp.]MCI1932304.1 LUD domain-containing protein [Ancrocorticia sp.]MCI1962765.1 LUD domain-containing protein [Ancrocorticia sp.]MCI2001955.1 LUD domain-containing protein [Ancrocorticia sp.]